MEGLLPSQSSQSVLPRGAIQRKTFSPMMSASALRFLLCPKDRSGTKLSSLHPGLPEIRTGQVLSEHFVNSTLCAQILLVSEFFLDIHWEYSPNTATRWDFFHPAGQTISTAFPRSMRFKSFVCLKGVTKWNNLKPPGNGWLSLALYWD